MHQGRYTSSALLLLFASIMVGFVAPPVVALDVHLSKSKKEALAYCNNIRDVIEGDSGEELSQQAKYTHDVVYPDQQGNDVIYNCGYESELATGVNRSKKDCKRASRKYKDTPDSNLQYECLWDGRWVILYCSPERYHYTCTYPELEKYLEEYFRNHPELHRTLRKVLFGDDDDDPEKFLRTVRALHGKAEKKMRRILERIIQYYKDSKQHMVDRINCFAKSDNGTQTIN